MSTKNMPGFTAEDSLYRTNGHYASFGLWRTINWSARECDSISPAETIEVHGCAPGSYLVDNGDGTWDCWSNPDPWGGGGGGGGAGAPGVPSDSSGGGGGKPPKGRPPNKPRSTPPKKYTPKNGQPCYVEQSVTSGNVTIIDVYLNGTYQRRGQKAWFCNTDDGGNSAPCIDSWIDGNGDKNTFRCYNGHNTE
jgi:hypothetical protein